MRVCPNVSEDLAYLCRLRHFIAALFSPLFGSVLVRLQYGCSTLSLCEGGVVEWTRDALTRKKGVACLPGSGTVH
jgi:hypothetical protein